MVIMRHLIQVMLMLWNKINSDKNINLHEPLYLEIMSDIRLSITIDNNVDTKLVIISKSNYSIDIDLKDNAKLIINSLNKDNNVCSTINLNNNSSIIYNHSVFTKENSLNYFKINHLSNNSTSNLYNNGVNKSDNKLFFTIDGVVNKGLSNITCNQNSKIINFGLGNSKIIPNLIINSNDIIASHSAYIGEINEDEKFYMKSRGIDDKNIEKMIYKATLLNKMTLDKEDEEFNKRINEWW